jgi:hypothetical protein
MSTKKKTTLKHPQPAATPTIAQGASNPQTPPDITPNPETIAQAETDAQIAALKEENAKLKKPKGIPSVLKSDPENVRKDASGQIIRDDELMQETLAEAISKDPADLTLADKTSIEREIRRYVKRGGVQRDPATGSIIKDHTTGKPILIPGGFCKGITDAQKKRCIVFLARLGRNTENPTWDENIRVPGFETAE